jgi:hypothetical protein
LNLIPDSFYPLRSALLRLKEKIPRLGLKEAGARVHCLTEANIVHNKPRELNSIAES